jgi:hypothetical protein
VQSPPLEGALHSYPASWKDPYRQALQESDERKLTEQVLAAESAVVHRLQELGDSDLREERVDLKCVAADLLAIETHKLG